MKLCIGCTHNTSAERPNLLNAVKMALRSIELYGHGDKIIADELRAVIKEEESR